MNKKINAKQIKTILIDYLLTNYDVDLIASEVPYLFGYRRADLLAIINDKTIGFEIKSELDTLGKLEEQVNDYVDVFNEVYVVLANKFKNNPILSKIPKKVGILYINKYNQISLYRKAKEQKMLNPEKLVYFFKKNEMTKLNNIDSSLSLRKTREKFLKTNSIKTIISYSKDILKNKYIEKYNTFINEKGDYTIEEDLLLITGKDKNIQALHLS